MRQRWLPVAVLAAVLFAIDVVTRLVLRIGFTDDATAQSRVVLVMYALIGLIFAGLAFLRARHQPVAEWAGDLTVAGAAGMLFSIFVGPFVNGRTPFDDRAGEFFSQVWLYAGFALGGALLGYLVATALGLDYRSQSLKRFAEQKLARPRRVVRR